MSGWSSGYVTDVGYTYGLYRELVPALLSFAVLNAGILGPDVGRALQYCELGCGQGLSANLLAAANPNIEFHATDFNPAHIAGALDLAAAAGTRNVHFYDSSFADFAAEPDLPDFDIIALHGIYSWISAENRRHIVNFIQRRLKVGGLVYISYNAMPGWAASMPLRRLMANKAAATSGPTPFKVDEALASVERLAQVKPLYFRAHQAVAESIARIKEQNRNYVAHEYFNQDLTPFYHEEVAADLAEAKLSFVCSAHLADNLVVANLTPEQQTFLAGFQSVSERETMRDFILNQRFRRDIFIKGPLTLSVGEARAIWEKTRFALTTRREDISLKVTGVLGEVTLKEEVYSPILDVFDREGSRTFGELLADPAIAAIGRQALQQALTVLVGANHIQPALDAASQADRAAPVQAFNDAIMEKSRSNRHLLFLASPVIGSGINVERIPQLFLLARRKGHADPPAFVWGELDRVGHKVARDGKALMTPEENLTELRERFVQFERRQLPLLQSIGVA